VRSATGLGSTAGATELTGGVLELRGGITIAGESLAIDIGPAEAIDIGPAEIHSAGGVNAWTGAWIIEPICSPIVVETGSTLTASGVLSCVGGLHKDGLGTFILSGANTYRGVTHVLPATLLVRSATGLGSTAGATELMGGILELRGGITVA